jgi:hypothetical protein
VALLTARAGKQNDGAGPTPIIDGIKLTSAYLTFASATGDPTIPACTDGKMVKAEQIGNSVHRGPQLAHT